MNILRWVKRHLIPCSGPEVLTIKQAKVRRKSMIERVRLSMARKKKL